MGPSGRHFTSAEEELLTTLANAVAVAVSNARTQAAVAESELLLRSVYEAIGSGVLVFDARGRVIHANGAAEEILGRARAVLLGMHSEQFRPGVREDGSPLPDTDRPWAVAVETRAPVRKAILGVVRPDGQPRWLQVDAVPLSGGDGEIARVIASFIDISERKRSEEALRQRDAILEAVAFAAEQLLSTDHWEQSIDAVLCRLGAGLGVSRVYIVPAGGEPPAQTPIYEWTADVVPPRAAPPPGATYLEAIGLARWETILREGGIVLGQVASFPDDERDVLNRHGVRSVIAVPIFAGHTWWGFIGFDDCRAEREWGPGTVEVLRTAAGTLGAAILRGRAEAERLQLVSEQAARAEAEAAQERLALLAGASHLLATSLDYETTLQSVAGLVVPYLADYCVVDMRQPDGSVRRIAMAHAAARNDPTSRLASAEYQIDPSSSHPVAQVLRTGKPLLFPRLDSPATPEWVRAGIALEPLVAGEFTSGLLVPLETRAGTAGVLTCLAWGQRAAYDLRDLSLAQDLARRCALAIDNATLYREAREAISIRDEFLSVAAHELKTPMTSLRGYAQLLGREFERGDVPNPERARRAASTIQVQADKLARLVAQLLDISRLESGKLAIERKPTNFSQLVREVVDAARPQLKDHALMALLPEDLWLSVDPLRMEQVVTNLVDNAIKYSPEGGRIDVTLEADEERGQVRLAVRDRGLGVPEEHRAHIFDRFYQAHAGGPLTSMAGMGLGLYISRQIVELHGGEIAAEFPDERGTRFIVSLPLGEAAHAVLGGRD
jgi:PAS domain S-box-containing protein